MSDVTVENAWMQMTVEDVAVSILSGAWKNSDDPEGFVDTFRDFFTGVTTLRSNLDKQIWDGHDDGSVDTAIVSIRERRTGDKPGRKPQVKSLAEQLLRK